MQLIYCGIILIHGGQCLWIFKILLVCGNKISWGTGLLQYNSRQFISLLNVHGDINYWAKVTHEIHTILIPHKQWWLQGISYYRTVFMILAKMLNELLLFFHWIVVILSSEEEGRMAKREEEEEDEGLECPQASSQWLPPLSEREKGNTSQGKSFHGLCWNDSSVGGRVDQITTAWETGKKRDTAEFAPFHRETVRGDIKTENFDERGVQIVWGCCCNILFNSMM